MEELRKKIISLKTEIETGNYNGELTRELWAECESTLDIIGRNEPSQGTLSENKEVNGYVCLAFEIGNEPICETRCIGCKIDNP